MLFYFLDISYPKTIWCVYVFLYLNISPVVTFLSLSIRIKNLVYVDSVYWSQFFFSAFVVIFLSISKTDHFLPVLSIFCRIYVNKFCNCFVIHWHFWYDMKYLILLHTENWAPFPKILWCGFEIHISMSSMHSQGITCDGRYTMTIRRLRIWSFKNNFNYFYILAWMS